MALGMAEVLILSQEDLELLYNQTAHGHLNVYCMTPLK